MDAEDARTIGQRVRQIRYARRKSLRVVAGLAGMSKMYTESALVRANRLTVTERAMLHNTAPATSPSSTRCKTA